MEFKVWVDGIQRVVCGVTNETTCQDIIFALAHATGKIGRFSLQEKWRDNVRLLVPSEHPLETLRKWGEYAAEVQYVLRHSDKNCNDPAKTSHAQTSTFPRKSDKKAISSSVTPVASNNLKKSLSFSGAGGFQQRKSESRKSDLESLAETGESACDRRRGIRGGSAEPTTGSLTRIEHRFRRETSSASPERVRPRSSSKSPHRSSLDRKRNQSSSTSLERSRNSVDPKQRDSSSKRERTSQKFSLIHPISSPGSDKLTSPSPGSDKLTTPKPSATKIVTDLVTEFESLNLPDVVAKGGYDKNEFEQQILEQGTREDLNKLVELQVERLKLQVSQMRIIDSEITFWEEKENEASQISTRVAAEITQLDEKLREIDEEKSRYAENSDQLKTEELKTNEIRMNLQSFEAKIRNCDKKREEREKEIDALTKDVERERLALTDLETRNREHGQELTRELRLVDAEMRSRMDEYLGDKSRLEAVDADIRKLDADLERKKSTLRDVEAELRKLNLHTFVKPSLDDNRIIDEKTSATSPRPGSGRKLANPKSLVEAVATSKNPHGMWV